MLDGLRNKAYVSEGYSNLLSNSSVWSRGHSASIVCPMTEPVITVILMIYRRYIKKRWWGLFLTKLGLARSGWGAGKEKPVCPRGNLFSNSTVGTHRRVGFRIQESPETICLAPTSMRPSRMARIQRFSKTVYPSDTHTFFLCWPAPETSSSLIRLIDGLSLWASYIRHSVVSDTSRRAKCVSLRGKLFSKIAGQYL